MDVAASGKCLARVKDQTGFGSLGASENNLMQLAEALEETNRKSSPRMWYGLETHYRVLGKMVEAETLHTNVHLTGRELFDCRLNDGKLNFLVSL